MTIIPRVQPTAVLASAHGSPAQRAEKMDKLCDELGSWLLQRVSSCHAKRKSVLGNLPRDIAQLTTDDVQKYCNKKHSGIEISITGKRLEQTYEKPLFVDESRKSIRGFNINIPILRYSENLVNGFENTINYISHEYFHFVDDILNPKKPARVVECAQTLSESTQDNAKSFYTDNIYDSFGGEGMDPTFPEQERLKNLRRYIDRYFKDEGLSSNNKITILQRWRYDISSEQGAYQKGDEISAKAIEMVTLKKPEKDQDPLFSLDADIYPQKHQLLCDMLREEITAHRKAHAEKMHSQQKSG